MLETEIQKLTAAIEALTVQVKTLRALSVDPSQKVRSENNSEVAPKADQKPAIKATSNYPSISKDNLKDIALEISKADSDAKVEILAILSAHGAKTITALPNDDDTLFDVFTRLNNLAARVAKAAE